MYLYEIYDAPDATLLAELERLQGTTASPINACRCVPVCSIAHKLTDEIPLSSIIETLRERQIIVGGLSRPSNDELLAAIREELRERSATAGLSAAVQDLFTSIDAEHLGMLEDSVSSSPKLSSLCQAVNSTCTAPETQTCDLVLLRSASPPVPSVATLLGREDCVSSVANEKPRPFLVQPAQQASCHTNDALAPDSARTACTGLASECSAEWDRDAGLEALNCSMGTAGTGATPSQAQLCSMAPAAQPAESGQASPAHAASSLPPCPATVDADRCDFAPMCLQGRASHEPLPSAAQVRCAAGSTTAALGARPAVSGTSPEVHMAHCSGTLGEGPAPDRQQSTSVERVAGDPEAQSPSPQLSVVEMARLAFRMEKQQVSRARKAIVRRASPVRQLSLGTETRTVQPRRVWPQQSAAPSPPAGQTAAERIHETLSAVAKKSRAGVRGTGVQGDSATLQSHFGASGQPCLGGAVRGCYNTCVRQASITQPCDTPAGALSPRDTSCRLTACDGAAERHTAACNVSGAAQTHSPESPRSVSGCSAMAAANDRRAQDDGILPAGNATVLDSSQEQFASADPTPAMHGLAGAERRCELLLSAAVVTMEPCGRSPSQSMKAAEKTRRQEGQCGAASARSSRNADLVLNDSFDEAQWRAATVQRPCSAVDAGSGSDAAAVRSTDAPVKVALGAGAAMALDMWTDWQLCAAAAADVPHTVSAWGAGSDLAITELLRRYKPLARWSSASCDLLAMCDSSSKGGAYGQLQPGTRDAALQNEAAVASEGNGKRSDAPSETGTAASIPPLDPLQQAGEPGTECVQGMLRAHSSDVQPPQLGTFLSLQMRRTCAAVDRSDSAASTALPSAKASAIGVPLAGYPHADPGHLSGAQRANNTSRGSLAASRLQPVSGSSKQQPPQTVPFAGMPRAHSSDVQPEASRCAPVQPAQPLYLRLEDILQPHRPRSAGAVPVPRASAVEARTAAAEPNDIRSTGKQAAAGDRLASVSRDAAQVHGRSNHARSPSATAGGMSCAKTIAPIDSSRSLVPTMPPIYPPVFPAFEAISSLYWMCERPQAPLAPQRERAADLAADVETCFDSILARSRQWFRRHPDQGPGAAGDGSPGVSLPPVRSASASRATDRFANAAVAARRAAVAGSAAVAVPGWVPQLPTAAVRRYFRVVTTVEHPEVAQLVRSSMQKLGWREDREGADVTDANGATAAAGSDCGTMCYMWNLLWTWSARVHTPHSSLLTWQRVNHFQEVRSLTRKDLLKAHMERHAAIFAATRHAAFFACMPTTFSLPKQYDAFAAAFSGVAADGDDEGGAGDDAAQKGPRCAPCSSVEPSQQGGLNVWILKPSALSRGRGIYLVDSLSDVLYSQPSVMQRYITEPLLLDGYKFDLRLYICVTSFNPLEAFIYEEGFARFAVQPYTNSAEQISNAFVHLTNASIQRSHRETELPAFLNPSKEFPLDGGTKMSLSRLWNLLEKRGIPKAKLWPSICSCVLAALFSAQDSIPYQVNAFELFGVDVIVDEQLRVWLLEVNGSPSLNLGTPLDEHIKTRLMGDLIQLVDPLPFDRVALHGVLSRRRQRKRAGGGLLAGTASQERDALNADLHAVLKGHVPRAVTQLPVRMGAFERIAPCALLQQFSRMKRQPA